MSPVLLLQAKMPGPGAVRGRFSQPRMATDVEAPRPTRDRTDGRSPGSRVCARPRLPGFNPSGLWHGLTAYSCGGSCGFGSQSRTAFPVRSFAGKRPPVAGIRGGANAFVNAPAPRATLAPRGNLRENCASQPISPGGPDAL